MHECAFLYTSLVCISAPMCTHVCITTTFCGRRFAEDSLSCFDDGQCSRHGYIDVHRDLRKHLRRHFCQFVARLCATRTWTCAKVLLNVDMCRYRPVKQEQNGLSGLFGSVTLQQVPVDIPLCMHVFAHVVVGQAQGLRSRQFATRTCADTKTENVQSGP